VQPIDPETSAPDHAGRTDEGDPGAGPDVPAVQITYYTDPLCPWSWALEPHWRRLRCESDARLACRYVMGGMIADWRSYHDPLNSVHNPAQMALQCYQVRQLTGVPIDERLLREDPPDSSYPACLAVKAAERQGADAGDAYLRSLREAAMLEARNVARGDVLLSLAEVLAGSPPPGVAFDVDRFREDLLGPEVPEAFQDDLRDVRYRNIDRFPTLVLRAGDRPGIALVGYRPYEVLREALGRLIPDLRPLEGATGPGAYVPS